VSERQVHLQLDVIIHGSVISGQVSSAARPDRRFTGRLGMIAAIEDALEAVAKPDRRSGLSKREPPRSTPRGEQSQVCAEPGATDSGVDQFAP